MNSKTYQQRADELAAMIEQRLGVRGKGLERKLRRAGRLLPAHVQRDAQLLIQAVQSQASPKLSRMIDTAKVDRSAKAVAKHLDGINPTERKISRTVSFLSINAFNLLFIAAAVVAVMVWRNLF